MTEGVVVTIVTILIGTAGNYYLISAFEGSIFSICSTEVISAPWWEFNNKINPTIKPIKANNPNIAKSNGVQQVCLYLLAVILVAATDSLGLYELSIISIGYIYLVTYVTIPPLS